MESYIEICGNENSCVGCAACYNICKENAISMEYNNEGFLYPVIDKSGCINCRACSKVCPGNRQNEQRSEEKSYKKIAYQYSSKSEKTLENSSSGGAFEAIAREVFSLGGVVFGAAFDEKFGARHIYISDSTQLFQIMRSKYVQSELGNTYAVVRQFLEEGRPVLFSGTPCQVAGLSLFLRKKYNNLYLVDFVCHGVPSSEVWKSFIEEKEREQGSTVTDVSFRDKRNGWKEFGTSIKFANGEEYFEAHYVCAYMRAFLCDLILRRCCYHCLFKGENRYSDITLADFWGCDKEYPEMFNAKGSSLLIVNSLKGQEVISKIETSGFLCEVDMTRALLNNPAYYHSVGYNKKRDKFFKKYKNRKSISQYLQKSLIPDIPERIRRKINRLFAG